MFFDRADAGRSLAAALSAYRQTPAGLVVALPRGGVAVGYEVSLALQLPLEVFIVRKIGYPGNPECACAALTETGLLKMTEESQGIISVTSAYLDSAVSAERGEVLRRMQLYRGGRPFPSIRERTVILVDDGLATGATFEAALEALRQLHPAQLIGAVPVAPPETVQRLRPLVTELVVLEMPESFMSVGEAYQNFTQVEDDQVLQLLQHAARHAKGPPADSSNVN